MLHRRCCTQLVRMAAEAARTAAAAAPADLVAQCCSTRRKHNQLWHSADMRCCQECQGMSFPALRKVCGKIVVGMMVAEVNGVAAATKVAERVRGALGADLVACGRSNPYNRSQAQCFARMRHKL